MPHKPVMSDSARPFKTALLEPEKTFTRADRAWMGATIFALGMAIGATVSLEIMERQGAKHLSELSDKCRAQYGDRGYVTHDPRTNTLTCAWVKQ